MREELSLKILLAINDGYIDGSFCDLCNGLPNSTERYLCVNSDGDFVNIGKSVGYAMTIIM
jgi:hypothetical protein